MAAAPVVALGLIESGEPRAISTGWRLWNDHLGARPTTHDADALVDVRGIAPATRRLVATLEQLGWLLHPDHLPGPPRHHPAALQDRADDRR